METINILAGTALFALLYSFSDAWHDEKVIRNEKLKWFRVVIDWHTVDAFIKLLVSVFIGILFWFFTQDVILGIIAGSLIVLVRKGTFNFFLNSLMNYPKRHKKKTGFDRIPNWIAWILLAGLIVLIIVKY